MRRAVMAICLTMFIAPAALAGQDAEAIAEALEERLGDALILAGPLELRLYRDFDQEGAKYVFSVTRNSDRFVTRWRTRRGGAEAGVSYRMFGVGAFKTYADSGFESVDETTYNSRAEARANRAIGFVGIELCPGIAFFSATGHRGQSFTHVVCRPEPGRTYCREPSEPWIARARSLRYNGLIREVRLFEEAGCRGAARHYTLGGAGTEVSRIKLTADDGRRIRSFSLAF